MQRKCGTCQDKKNINVMYCAVVLSRGQSSNVFHMDGEGKLL